MSTMLSSERKPIGEIVRYFLRLGTFGFGGPVALGGLMEKELVQEKHWLSKEEMRDAIAISQSLPGPLGRDPDLLYEGRLLGGLGRRLGFHPAELPHGRSARRTLCLFRRPAVDDGDLLRRQPRGDRAHPSFLLPAAIDTILGAAVLLGKIAIGDWLTALIAAASLAALFYWKRLSNPLLIAATALIGLAAFPLLQPDWVFVK